MRTINRPTNIVYIFMREHFEFFTFFLLVSEASEDFADVALEHGPAEDFS